MVSNIRGSGPFHVVYEAVGKVPKVVAYCTTREEARIETKRRNELLPKPVSMPCDFYSVKCQDNISYGFEDAHLHAKLPEIPVCRSRGLGTNCKGRQRSSRASRDRNSNH